MKSYKTYTAALSVVMASLIFLACKENERAVDIEIDPIVKNALGSFDLTAGDCANAFEDDGDKFDGPCFQPEVYSIHVARVRASACSPADSTQYVLCPANSAGLLDETKMSGFRIIEERVLATFDTPLELKFGGGRVSLGNDIKLQSMLGLLTLEVAAIDAILPDDKFQEGENEFVGSTFRLCAGAEGCPGIEGSKKGDILVRKEGSTTWLWFVDASEADYLPGRPEGEGLEAVQLTQVAESGEGNYEIAIPNESLTPISVSIPKILITLEINNQFTVRCEAPFVDEFCNIDLPEAVTVATPNFFQFSWKELI